MARIFWARQSLVAALLPFLLPSLAAAQQSTQALADFKSNFARIQNIKVYYSLELQEDPGDLAGIPIQVQGRTIIMKPTDRRFEGCFSYLNGESISDLKPTRASSLATPATTKSSNETPQFEATETKIVTSEKRIETLDYYSMRPPIGSIEDNASLFSKNEMFIDVGLGVRLFEQPNFLAMSDLGQATITPTADGKYLVQLKTSRNNYSWIFDDTLQATLSCSVSAPGRPDFFVFEYRKFAKVDGVTLPYEMLARRLVFYEDSQGKYNGKTCVAEKVTIEVDRYVIGDKNNVKENYLMVWPKGAGVFDTRVHHAFVIRSGDRTLPDEFIFKTLKYTTAPSTRP